AAIAHGLPGAAWSAWFFQASIGLTLVFFLILQLFPTGRPLSAGWRILVALTVANGALAFLVPALGVTAEFRANFPTVAHPLQVISAGVTDTLDNVTGLATVLIFVASAIEIALRFRRSTGEQRAQLKWFAAAAAI